MADDEIVNEELPTSTSRSADEPVAQPAVKMAPAPAAAQVTVAQMRTQLVDYAARTTVTVRTSFAKCNKVNFDALSKKYVIVITAALDSELLSKSSAGKKAKSVVPQLAKACAAGELLSPFVVLYVRVLFEARNSAATPRNQHETPTQKTAIAYYAVLEYTPPSLLPAIWGAILCFFGGEYITVIAAIESFEHSGGDAALKAAWALADQAFAAIDASTAGNEAALAKLESRELLAHKAAIVANALDPAVTQASLGQLYLCWMAMLATLKIQFARTVSLGLSISKSLRPFGVKYVVPALQEAAPKDVKKWVPIIFDFAVKAFVVSVAWMIQTVVSTVQSALRGGVMFSTHIVAFLSSKKYIKPIPADSVTLEIISLGVALLGVLFQVSNGWGVPFPLNLVTWPLDILEWVLRWQISHGYGDDLA